jgi:predicted kinase
MEAVILCGIQGSGKTTFYRDRFAETHVRISRDALRTRHREQALLQECLDARQPFVVDNTNPTAEQRRQYVRPASEAGFRVVGYHFDATTRQAIAANQRRPANERIPVPAILATYRRLELPRKEEGFAAIYRVRVDLDRGFAVERTDGSG